MEQDRRVAVGTRRTFLGGVATLAAGGLSIRAAFPVNTAGLFPYYVEGTCTFTWNQRGYGSVIETTYRAELSFLGFISGSIIKYSAWNGAGVKLVRTYHATHLSGTAEGSDIVTPTSNTHFCHLDLDAKTIVFLFGGTTFPPMTIVILYRNGDSATYENLVDVPPQLRGAIYMPTTIDLTSGRVYGSIDIAHDAVGEYGNYAGTLVGSWDLSIPVASPSPVPSPSPSCTVGVAFPNWSHKTILQSLTNFKSFEIVEQIELALNLTAAGVHCPEARVTVNPGADPAFMIGGGGSIFTLAESGTATYRGTAVSPGDDRHTEVVVNPAIFPVISDITAKSVRSLSVGTIEEDKYKVTVEYSWDLTLRLIRVTSANAVELVAEYMRSIVVVGVIIAALGRAVIPALPFIPAVANQLLVALKAAFAAVVLGAVGATSTQSRFVLSASGLPSPQLLADLRAVFGPHFVATSTIDGLMLDRAQLAPGGLLYCGGSGFTPGGLVHLSVVPAGGTAAVYTTSARADAGGAIQSNIQIPPAGQTGRWLVTAIDVTSMHEQLHDIAAGTGTAITPYVLAANVEVQAQSSYVITLTSTGPGSIDPSPAGPTYAAGLPISLMARSSSNAIFAGWTVDGAFAGWANPLQLTMSSEHIVHAVMLPRPAFPDVSPATTGATEPISQLAARGIIKGYEDGNFGPSDSTLRAQMAALIARAMPGDLASAPGIGPQTWALEDHDNTFADQSDVDEALWRNVGTLAHYEVARGYGDGTYGPVNDVLNAQVISFITRAMVKKGYWTFQTDDGSVYPNVPQESGHRQDLATYVHYAGALRGADNPTGEFVGWDQPSTRAWFAFALWQALDKHWG